jgi:hypothetical protein
MTLAFTKNIIFSALASLSLALFCTETLEEYLTRTHRFFRRRLPQT